MICLQFHLGFEPGHEPRAWTLDCQTPSLLSSQSSGLYYSVSAICHVPSPLAGKFLKCHFVQGASFCLLGDPHFPYVPLKLVSSQGNQVMAGLSCPGLGAFQTPCTP